MRARRAAPPQMLRAGGPSKFRARQRLTREPPPGVRRRPEEWQPTTYSNRAPSISAPPTPRNPRPLLLGDHPRPLSFAAAAGRPPEMDDSGGLPGLFQAVGPKEASLFTKFVRAAGPYAREAISKAKDLGRRFTYRRTPSLTRNNLSEITACLHQECWDYTSVGAQLVHSLVTGKTRLSAGVEHAVNTAFVMKARGDHTGHVSALGRLQLTPNSSLTMCAEVDVRSIRQAPRVGISFRF